MVRSSGFAIVLLLTAMCAAPVLAWNNEGHQVVAAIAWERLAPADRTKIVDTLRKHPRFSQDFASSMQQELGNHPSAAEEERWIFCHAATWPDIARGFNASNKAIYHRGSWHYINLPVFLDAAQAAHFAGGVGTNISFDYPTRRIETEWNVAQSIKHNVSRASNATSDDQAKAVAYCWLLHTIGDLHQPAHAAAIFTTNLFRHGDKGGNSIPIKRPDGSNGNLHSYWDGLLGKSNKVSDAVSKAADLKTKFPTEWNAAFGPIPHDVWTTESQQIALQKTYGPLMGELSDAESDGHLDKISITNTYDTESQNTAARQAVIAGVRLAGVLQSIVQPPSTPNVSPSLALDFPTAIAATRPEARAARTRALAQAARSSEGDSDLDARLKRLEAEVAELRAQLAGVHDTSASGTHEDDEDEEARAEAEERD